MSARAMLLGSGSIAFGLWELCFWALRALLLESESNAFGSWEHSFWRLRALLLETENNVFVRLSCMSSPPHFELKKCVNYVPTHVK